MIRRLAPSLGLIAALFLAVPVAGSTAPPVPTAGLAFQEITRCNPISCPGPNAIYAYFQFLGGLELDGGSWLGFWGVDAVASRACDSCPYGFGETTVSRGGGLEAPFPAGACVDFICLDGWVEPVGPNITGSCSGWQSALGTWTLDCSFKTPGGLSGDRRIRVIAPVWDASDIPCQFLCAIAYETDQYYGVYKGVA